MFRHAVLLLIFLPVLLLPGCGGAGPEPPVGSPEGGGPPPGGAAGSYSQPSTATPWPTFTPVPTLTPVPAPAPTQTPLPTATLWPIRPSGLAGLTLPPGDVALTPGAPGVPPTPYGKLPDAWVFLDKQALTAFWGGPLPEYLQARQWDRLPAPVELVSTDTRYMLWVVVFDFRQAEPDYEMRGYVRWLNLLPDADPLVMFESPMTVSSASPFFFHGLGGDEPGLWSPGLYRVEFLDDRHRVVVDADFEVRS